MPSNYTASARYTLQATGENVNQWGQILNTGVFQLVDTNINGRLAFLLAGTKTLTTANGATDEARNAILDVTGGTGGTVKVPSVSKWYIVRNAAVGDTTISAGGPTTATIRTGDVGLVFTDGVSVYPLMIAGLSIRDYINQVAWSYNAGNLPAQPGNAGKWVKTNGTTASWQTIHDTDIPELVVAKSRRRLMTRELY